MASVRSTAQPAQIAAVAECAAALRKFAGYSLERSLQRRMSHLLRNKERLSAAERLELQGLVTFWQKRTIDMLEARVALKTLAEAFPDVVTEQ
jgi:hypothetical protein